MPQTAEVFNFVTPNIQKTGPLESSSPNRHTETHDGGNGGGDNMLEARVARLEVDVSYIRRDVDELRTDVKSINQNMIVALERLESIKENLNKKPSTDTVDKKISDAKLAILLGVPTIIAIGTGIYKLIQHYL